MNLALQYIEDVTSGKVVSCELVKRSVERHLTDLETAHERGFYFDAEAGENILTTFRYFRHTAGTYAKKPFQLLAWQAFVLWVLFGWKRTEDGQRRFSKAYVEVAKKNGKTEMAGALGLIGAFFDGMF